MIKVGNIGIDLMDDTKEPSKKNKILRFHYFGKCSKCNEETELTDRMFSDSCECKHSSFTGWKYKCNCGNIVQIWEGAFDSMTESFFENDFVKLEE